MSRVQRSFDHDERGLVAIVVTMMMLIIVSVIVLSFAQTVRREQRAQLDRQLSSRAFYAAESGVNLARKALAADTSLTKATCAPLVTGDPSGLDDAGYKIESATNTEVTCLTVNPAPTKLHFDNVGMQSKIFPIETSTPLDTITLRWNTKTTANLPGCIASLPATPAFPAQGSWPCSESLLRVDIVNTNGSFVRSDLPGRTATFFIYPVTGAGSGAPDSDFAGATDTNQGKVIAARCTAVSGDAECVATITGMSYTNLAVRAMSFYQDAGLSVEVSGGGVNLPISGAQAVIDSTGKSQDVLRRIRVTVPLSGGASYPDWALAAGQGICKRYKVGADVTVEAPYNNDDSCKIQ